VIEALRVWSAVALVALGVFFTFIAAVGVIRLPDVYARTHTASQADTLGAGFTLAGVAVALGWQHATAYTVLLLFFVFVTNPTAAHAIARSAAETGVEPLLADDGSGSAGDAEPADADAEPRERDAGGEPQ